LCACAISPHCNNFWLGDFTCGCVFLLAWTGHVFYWLSGVCLICKSNLPWLLSFFSLLCWLWLQLVTTAYSFASLDDLLFPFAFTCWVFYLCTFQPSVFFEERNSRSSLFLYDYTFCWQPEELWARVSYFYSWKTSRTPLTWCH